MTSNELMDRIKQQSKVIYADQTQLICWFAALCALVELHQPTNDPLSVTTFCLQCRDRDWPAEYPCATIQAIEKELR